MAAGDFLTYKFPVWKWCVRLPSIWSSRPQVTSYREKGDPSKARDYLPADKQYLITHGVPCLRRATSLAYTDADEDAERLLNFSEASGAGDKDDEWVETHAGRKANTDAANPGEIEDIPDDDAHNDEGLSSGVANLSVSADATPDLDDIPDMEEDELEEGDEAAAAPKPVAKPAGVLEARCVALLLLVFHF